MGWTQNECSQNTSNDNDRIKVYSDQSKEANTQRLKVKASHTMNKAVECNLCGCMLTGHTYLKNHQWTKCARGQSDWTTVRTGRLAGMVQPQNESTMEEESHPSEEYKFSMPLNQTTSCPIQDCPFTATIQTTMR
jgi:hypothetical protein